MLTSFSILKKNRVMLKAASKHVTFFVFKHGFCILSETSMVIKNRLPVGFILLYDSCKALFIAETIAGLFGNSFFFSCCWRSVPLLSPEVTSLLFKYFACCGSIGLKVLYIIF